MSDDFSVFKFPEVRSMEESVAILDKYRPFLTSEQYDAILGTIGTNNIEGIHLNEDCIVALVRMAVYNISADDMISEVLEKFKNE